MFKDRFEAATLLVKALEKYKNKKDTIILAIPRGALQIGQILHEELCLPLDIIVTKKISHPMSEEFAIGAVGPGGEYFVDRSASAEVSDSYIEAQRRRLEILVEEKYKHYRGDRVKPKLRGKLVIIVDDGIATGSTILAAIHVIKKQKPAKIVVAVPVGPVDSVKRIGAEVDEIVCLLQPEVFFAIGAFYHSFPQVEDEEAISILKKCQ